MKRSGALEMFLSRKVFSYGDINRIADYVHSTMKELIKKSQMDLFGEVERIN
jgi:hypothetical protein